MTTTTPEPEQRSPQERVVKLNEEFQLFGSDTVNLQEENPRLHKEYTGSFRLNLKEGLSLDFYPHLGGFWGCFKFDTITPLDTESGYTITNEDFDPETRYRKLRRVAGLGDEQVLEDRFYDVPDTDNQEGMLYLYSQGDLFTGPKASNITEDDLDELARLALLVTAEGQTYISKPEWPIDPSEIGTEDAILNFFTFKPIDFKEDFPMTLPTTRGERETIEGVFGSNFKLGFPVEAEVLEKIRAKFVLLPPVEQSGANA